MDEQANSTHQTYQIGGRTFTALPVVARQEKWLWPIMRQMFIKGDNLSADDIFGLMAEQITRIAAILLIPDGQTQVQKARAGIAGVEQLESWLDESVSVSELGPVIADFFTSGQQWKMFQGLAGPMSNRMTTGSTTPWSPSQTETSSAPNGSGPMFDFVNIDSRSSVDGSAVPLSAPS